MRRAGFFAALLACVFLTALLSADCTKDHDHRSSKNSGLSISELTIVGTQSLSSDELATIASELTDQCFDENSQEIEQRVRALFQDRGYFSAQVKSLRIKPTDPLAVPKPAILEADVLEGPQYTLAEIGFVGNHAFDADQLRAKFSLKRGDLFAREKLAGSLGRLRELYVSHGFIDLTFIPETENLSNATVLLSVSIVEGPQYRMGSLKIYAKKEIAERLQAEWQMPEGAVFDWSYLERYIDDNRSLLPPEFQERHVQVVRDCRNATVDVRFPLDAMDPGSQSVPKDSECDSPDSASK